MKQQLQKKIQKQALKDEKIRQMEISGAETVIQSLTEEGFNVKGEFLENAERPLHFRWTIPA